MNNPYQDIKAGMHKLVNIFSQQLQTECISLTELNDAYQEIDSLTNNVDNAKTIHDILRKYIYPTIYHLTEKIVATNDKGTKQQISKVITELEEIFNAIIDNIEDQDVTEELIKELESICNTCNQAPIIDEDQSVQQHDAEIDEFFTNPESKFEINKNIGSNLTKMFNEIDELFEQEDTNANSENGTSFATIVGIGITVIVVAGVFYALFRRFK